jgi:tetratricopeptide (TPR) repeat protein
MGMAYGNLGNVAKKKECFQKAADLGDTDAQKWLRDGEKPTQASSSKTATEYSNDGNAAFAQKNYSLAIQHYQKAIDIDPTIAEAHYNLGVAYYYQRELPQTIRCYRKAKEVNPKYAGADVALARAYSDSATIPAYQKLIALNPKDVEAYYNMGKAYTYKEPKDYQQALRCWQKAVELSPKEAKVYEEMGRVYFFTLKDYLETVRCYEKVIEIDPTHAQAYFMIGNAYDKQGDKSKQTEYYQKAARLGHENAQKRLKENGYEW